MNLGTLKWLPRRIAAGRNWFTGSLANSLTDLRVLTRSWAGGPVYRQQRVDGFELLMRVDLDVGHQIYFHRNYERYDSLYIRRAIAATDVCFDLGANIGYYTILMARAAIRGKVHAFEPLALPYQLLKVNVLLNRIENAVLNNCTIGDATAEVDFVESQDDAFSSLLDTHRHPVSCKVRTEMTTIDQYCEAQNIRRVDFVKADVEGAEEKVLKGASEILSDPERRPRILMLELHNPMLQAHGSTIEQVLEIAQGYGYSSYVCQRHRLVPYTRRHFDYFQNVFFLSGASNATSK